MISSTCPTPLHGLPGTSARLGVDIWVKRDDLFPIAGGGTKGRKILAIVSEAATSGVTALVTTGGVQSNHARVTALVAAEHGWKCHLVLHGDPESLDRPEGNLLLSLLAGAEVVVVDPPSVADVLRSEEARLRERGENPLVIAGGGHSIAGARALVDAVMEVAKQLEAVSWFPDWLVTATGTGGTQAGLLAGFHRLQVAPRVMGISIGRSHARGKPPIVELLEQLIPERERPLPPVELSDEWLLGGYEKSTPIVAATIRRVAHADGLLLDPTYTGKAFTGLTDLVQSGTIPQGSRVLFWHTGGLLNLLASDQLRSAPS